MSSAAVLQQLSQESHQSQQQPGPSKGSLDVLNEVSAGQSAATQKMVTADGNITYVPPEQVTSYEDNGATLIPADGRFTVKNLRSDGSEFPDSIPDVRERAVNVARALGSEQMKRSVTAEQNYYTSSQGLKDDAKGVGNVALAAGGTMAALAAPGVVARVFAPTVAPVAGGVGFGGAAAGEVAGPSLASQAATWVGRQLLAQAGKITAGSIVGGGLLGKVMHWW